MAEPYPHRFFLIVYLLKSYAIYLVLGLAVWTGRPLQAQSILQVDSLPSEGLVFRSGWRWHPGDNRVWISPAFDDSRWDTIQPNRSITRLPDLARTGIGWLRLTINLDSTVAQKRLAFIIGQFGASEIYLDGTMVCRLGKVGLTYSQQEAYLPTDKDVFLLPDVSAGHHVIAVRLSQHRPSWYTPKLIYFSQPVFLLELYPADGLTNQVASKIYAQALGNYTLVGIFLMLGVVHFMYFYYRRKQINLIFCLTMFFGAGCVILIELVGLSSTPLVSEWLFLGQGICLILFMVFMLITYYSYLEQPVAWHLWVVGILLLIPRIVSGYTAAFTFLNVASLLALIALFADGIRISITAIRAGRINDRFILTSLLLMVLILVVGAGISWWLSVRNPAYISYSNALTNLLFFITLPISFAIILAREYAQTNRNLEDRLAEVAQLSQEKETILTQQNEMLERQVVERTVELTQSLTELRETQQQLIQREKMASLGELTAGIAHEIQNPLNFVNNFAEVSGELVHELKEILDNDSRDVELEAEILADLEQNLQKINHHGGRASSIVRGMLEHSRTSAGRSEMTDLNALADEYLHLSYHGLRAKDKNFNAHLVTQFDPTISQITVVAQDIGRVLLNLFNNAFYAVQERQRLAPSTYQPTVTVATRHWEKGIEIQVSDNGLGIPEAIREKIFQPFFTTKPTGQGTGLGLSLSYDIITKGHSGYFVLDTSNNEGATFLIQLPT
ncbi:ATP-binding protein [Spirosoma linguale]|uniref:histidine kinase n=1 Tax=Spirosoma linguale (strain ATCC 33905 / DSM 74 / LMG 10896 / Claus 1) TaxID=504472 RepID=D2QJG5_SPILD|nr:histidine kinase [Spirosoma linguale DSM 74]